MAFNSGSGYVPPGSVFGGFSGGYTQTPEGYIITPGNNLPSVDPNNYHGSVHFGPPTTTFLGTPSVSFPVSGGVITAPLVGVPVAGAVVDPNLTAVGTPAVVVPVPGAVVGAPVVGVPVVGAVLGPPY